MFRSDVTEDSDPTLSSMAKLRLEAHLRPLTPQPDAGAVGDLRGFKMSLDEQQQGQRVACVQVLRDVICCFTVKVLCL